MIGIGMVTTAALKERLPDPDSGVTDGKVDMSLSPTRPLNNSRHHALGSRVLGYVGAQFPERFDQR